MKGIKQLKEECGEVMIEGMVVLTITMIMLIWILGLGFLYYQRYLVTIVTNDITAKIAATYNNPESDLIMGYIEEEELADRDLYRGYLSDTIKEINHAKATNYVQYMMEKTNFAGTVEDIHVDFQLIQDSPWRKHIEITTKCKFNTPFGFALDFEGMDGTVTYEATARADCTDIIDYYSLVDFAKYQLSGTPIKSEIIIKTINSLIKVYNHFK